MTWALAALAMLLSAPALAADFYLEGPAVETRAEAASLAAIAIEAGYRARVVRRYRHPSGWEFVFIAEGFEAEDVASEAARALATRSGRSVSVYASEAGSARRVEQQEPAAAAPQPQPSPPPTEEPDVDELLDRAVRAHGGPGDAISEAEAILFRFRRTLPDGSVAIHTYARRGADAYLSIEWEEGDKEDSRTRLVGGQAWLQVGDGDEAAQDVPRTKDVLARFTPEHVLSFPLGLAGAVAERPEFQRLHLDGETVVDGHRCHVLRFDGDRVSGALALALDAEQHRVRQVGFGAEAGALLHQFDAYRERPDGLVLPKTIRSWRDREVVDEVEIVELELAPRLPEEWFSPPAVD